MTTKKEVVHDWLGRWQRVIAVILSTAAVVGLLWANLAEPRIDSKINACVRPLHDAIEYQNFLMMSTMTDSAIERAERLYMSSRKGRGLR
jgi:hypothetical protein